MRASQFKCHILNHERTLWRNHLLMNTLFHSVRSVWKRIWGVCAKCHTLRSVKLHFGETIIQLTSRITTLEVFENLCGEWCGKWHVFHPMKEHGRETFFHVTSCLTNLEEFETYVYVHGKCYIFHHVKQPCGERSFKTNMSFLECRSWAFMWSLYWKCYEVTFFKFHWVKTSFK